MKKIIVTSAQVVLGNGADEIILQTTLPASLFPYTGTVQVKFHATQNTGASYVRMNLGIEPEIVPRPSN